MKIGLIVAMEKELVEVKKIFSSLQSNVVGCQEYFVGEINGNEVILTKCGIGKVNAAIGATIMIEHYHPDVIISTGVAGGASKELEIGDVVLSTGLSYHDVYCGPESGLGIVEGMPREFVCDKEIIDRIVSSGINNIHTGLIVSGDQFIDKVETINDILSNYPNALAVDMESCAIAHTCYIFSTRFLSIRVISDVPVKGDNIKEYKDFWGTMAEKLLILSRFILENIK